MTHSLATPGRCSDITWFRELNPTIYTVTMEKAQDNKLPFFHVLVDRSPTKSKARRTSKSSSTWWDWKVGYGGSYMEGKGKPSALMGWSWNNW